MENYNASECHKVDRRRKGGYGMPGQITAEDTFVTRTTETPPYMLLLLSRSVMSDSL